MSEDHFTTVMIDGRLAKSVSCPIISSPALDYMATLHQDAGSKILQKRYILKNPVRSVSYHPKQACHNLLNLCCYIDNYGWEDGTRELLGTLVCEIELHLKQDGEKVFVTYPFRYEELGKILQAGWSCALGQAFLLGAWVKLYCTTKEAKYLDYARKTYASLRRVRAFAGQNDLWVTFIDDKGFLWFEEYPSCSDPQTRILNGHIYTIMGIYSYYRIEPHTGVQHLMQAGMATVQEYFNDFRRPGKVNRYSLLAESGGDYMPSRSITQQKWLFDITGDQTFQQQYHAFKSDMGWSLKQPGEEYYNAK